MGQGSSKPPPSSTEHVFTSETPVRFSPDLIHALESSPEVTYFSTIFRPFIFDTLPAVLDRDSFQLTAPQTDSTRAKDLELHIQSRVTTELSRLSSSHSTTLAELADQISASDDGGTSSDDDPTESRASNRPSGKETRGKDLGRESVQKEIESLKAKLKGKNIREEVVRDKGVERVKDKMVACLRLNDRRPLDCWEEVEAFKREVGRLEKAFLGRVME